MDEEICVELDVVRTYLEALSTRAGLEGIASELSQCVIMSHLARYPRIDVLQEIQADLEVVSSQTCQLQVERAERGRVGLSIDCRRLPTIAAARLAADALRDGTASDGIAIVSLTNSGGMRTLDVWARLISMRDMISVVSWNGGPYVAVPAGGLEPFFGTNPLAYGLPVADGPPIVADFATTEIGFMELIEAQKGKRLLPTRAGLDARGRVSQLPDEVFVPPDSARLLAMGGGPKGSAVVLLLEVLTGAFVGGVMGRTASPRHVPHEFAGFVLALAPDMFVSGFKEKVATMAGEIRSSSGVPPENVVRLPGDVAKLRWSEAIHSGIPCSRRFVDGLEDASA